MCSTTIDEVEVDDELDSEDEVDMESGGDDILEGLSGSLRAPLHALFYGKNNHRFDSYSIMNNKGQHQVQSLIQFCHHHSLKVRIRKKYHPSNTHE